MSPEPDASAEEVASLEGEARWPLGIDIGYSEDRPTLGLASVRDVFTAYGLAPEKHVASFGHIFRVECRLEAALAWMRAVPVSLRRNVLATIDGPLGPHGPPRVQRYVDRACQGGRCQNRCPPSSVVGGGVDLVDATYRLLDALGPSTVLMSPLVPTVTGAVVGEVNPTLGLAWLVEFVEDWRSLPSRNRARKRKLPPVVLNGRVVRAKSEYYWEAGANRVVATALSSPEVALVRHHEAEASLYSLAVAAALGGCADGAFSTICIGGSDGIYHLLAPIHDSWHVERDRIGQVT